MQARYNAFAIMGGIVLDLREAQFEGMEVTINASCLMGGIEIVVPESTERQLRNGCRRDTLVPFVLLAAWMGSSARLIRDEGARHTAENAAHAVWIARSFGVREVVVVTSRWHAPRARTAFRWLLRGSGVSVVAAAPTEPRNVRAALRELAVWPLLPAQLWAAGSKSWRRPALD